MCSGKTVGIDDHQLCSIPLVAAGGDSQYHLRPDFLILHQYAHYGKGKPIHYHVQLEALRSEFDDKSIKIGGKKIRTHNGYVFAFGF